MSGRNHVVAIIGGGVAGAEAASRCSDRGIRSVVLEMNSLPWGKIELGLPKWHAKQRDQEKAMIDEKLSDPHVSFLPKTRLGSDLTVEELLEWGFSAVLLAVGAWRDRPLDVPGIDRFENAGFCYQNPLVAWFNQCDFVDYRGPRFQLADDAVVIGGGLASIDVVKILMLESTRSALQSRGQEVDLFELEKKGIPRVLEHLGLRWPELGLKGCTLFYRRRVQDMPLVPLEGEVTPERLVQAESVRRKLMENMRSKYLFHFRECCVPVEPISENERLTGLVFRQTEVREGRAHQIPGSEFMVRSPLFVSSIGSLPEAIPGIPMDRYLYKLEDETVCRLAGFDRVFALGNAVTGRGNIRASRIHARETSDWIIERFLGFGAGGVGQVAGARPLNAEKTEQLFRHVRNRQERVGFDGDYRRWIEALYPAESKTQ